MAQAATEVAEARAEIDVERKRSARAAAALTGQLTDAEKRAASATMRVAELEQELDVVLSEWRSGQQPQQRKHA